MVFDFIKSVFKKESKDILSLILEVWDNLKKVFIAIFEFFNHLVDWFQSRIEKVLKKAPNSKAISLMVNENLSSGEYNVVNLGLKSRKAIVKTFYNMETGEIDTENTEITSYSMVDKETVEHFGDREMLIIE